MDTCTLKRAPQPSTGHQSSVGLLCKMVEALDARLAAMEGIGMTPEKAHRVIQQDRIEVLLERTDALDTRLKAIENRLDRLESRVE